MATRSEVCDALCGLLRDGVDVHRSLAAQTLGQIGDAGAVGTLLEALRDEDEDVRSDAAAALSRLADPSAGERLLENLLADPCNDVKLNAIDGLVRMRHAQMPHWLRRLLKGRDEEIVWDESEFHEEGWDDWVDIQVKAIEGLAELGVEDAVPEIVEAIDDEFGQDLSEVGFKALAKLGKDGLRALARYLDDRDERRRSRAASVLAAVDAEATRDAVDRALCDSSAEVRLAAARALAARDPSDHRLTDLFLDDDAEVRAEAVRLCGRQHPKWMERLLDDKAQAVQRAVLVVLAEVPDLLPADVVAERSRSLLRGSAPKLAARAALSLAAVAREAAVDDLVEQLGDAKRPIETRLAAVQGLAKIGGERAAHALIEVLGSDPRELRLKAMTVLAAMAGAQAEWPNVPGQALLAALRGELLAEPKDEGEAADGPPGESIRGADDRERGTAQPAFPTSTLQSILGQQQQPGADLEQAGRGVVMTEEDMDFLALSKPTVPKKHVPVTPPIAPHQDVRRFAARLLGDLPRAEVARELANGLDDRDGEVRLACADSLARVGEGMAALPQEVVGALVRAQGQSDRELRLFAARALSAADGQAAAKALRASLRDEEGFVRAEAVRALSRLGKAGPAIEALMKDPDPGVRLAAARAVADKGGSGTLEKLVDFAFAFEGYHRQEAGRLLRGVDAAAANARFLDVLGDPDRTRTWQVAIEALAELNRSDAAAEGPTAQRNIGMRR